MRFHRALTLTLATLAAAPLAAAGFGKPLKGLKPVALKELLAKPENGREVRLEGVIDAVCQDMGCWIGLKQGDQAIHVAMAGHSFFLPKDSKGKKVVVEGRVVVKERTADEVKHLESEGARAAAAKVSIEATGVEIVDSK